MSAAAIKAFPVSAQFGKIAWRLFISLKTYPFISCTVLSNEELRSLQRISAEISVSLVSHSVVSTVWWLFPSRAGPKLWAKLPKTRKSIQEASSLNLFKYRICQFNITQAVDDGCRGCSLCSSQTTIQCVVWDLRGTGTAVLSGRRL